MRSDWRTTLEAAPCFLMARRASIVVPPLAHPTRTRTNNCGGVLPSLRKDKQQPAIDRDHQTFTTHIAPVAGSANLRALARKQADRRHTVIQLELAAAHFETRMLAGQSEPEGVELPAKAKVWDEFITDESLKRKKKGRRTVKQQLEALSMYLERRNSLRRGAPLTGPLKDLRTSELHRFEILRKQVGAPASPRSQSSPRLGRAPQMPVAMRRRKSVAALPPILAKASSHEADISRRRSVSIPMPQRRVSLMPGEVRRRVSLAPQVAARMD